MKAPKVQTPKMGGPELVARVVALEGFVAVIAEHMLDNDKITLEGAKVIVRKMAADAQTLAQDVDHPEMSAKASEFIASFTSRLIDTLETLRDN